MDDTGDQWPWYVRKMIVATWRHTVAGPELYVCGVLAREWLGTDHDEACEKLCISINQAFVASQSQSSAEQK